MNCMHCTLEATYVDSHRRFCDMHYRFNQMRQDSTTRKKYKPTKEELLDLIPLDMTCSECKIKMVWRRKQNQKGVNNQVTLQHWRDGSISLICLSCNIRHASMPNDTYKEMEKDHKLCPKCKTIKHETNFCIKNSRSVLKRNSICNACNRTLSNEWRVANKEKVNKKMAEYRKNNPEKIAQYREKARLKRIAKKNDLPE